MLPLENEVRQEIETSFQKELTQARELLQLALDMLGCDGSGGLNVPSTPVKGVGNWARSLALGLYAKACKNFRVLIILGETGFGGEMAIQTRTLYETMLMIEFLMRERVVLKREGKEVDIDPSRPLTTDFRAQLYGARFALMAEKELKEWGERPEVKDSMFILGDPAKLVAQAALARNAIGDSWWKALKRGPAGLSVKDLADSLGLIPYYVLTYGDQSEVAHAGDAFRHFEVADNESHGVLDLTPSAERIGGRLNLACLVFLACLISVHNRLQFGSTVGSRIDSFAARLGVPSSQ